MPEIVGIGAVNVDYIVLGRLPAASTAIDRAAANDNELIEVLGSVEPGLERAVSAAEITSALQAIGAYETIVSAGGSSLNTLASIAATGAPVSVGFVGIRGQSGTDSLSLPSWFASLDIDDQHVGDSNDLAGICISHTSHGERTLLTTPGANQSVLDYLSRNRKAIVSYLCQAKVVLVTSFAGLADVSPLLEMLIEVKRKSPSTLLCSDPGAMWTNPPVPVGVDALLQLSDWLFLNQNEFDRYAGQMNGSDSAAVVLKRPDRIEIFTRSKAGFDGRIFQNPVVLRPDEIVDDTGTGDAFAAGLLLSLASPSFSTENGVELGFKLAGEKLRWPGLGGLEQYNDIYESCL